MDRGMHTLSLIEIESASIVFIINVDKIRVSVNALCMDNMGQISHDPHT